MFKEVREATLACGGSLALPTLVPDIYCHGWRGGIPRENDLKAVVQPVMLEIKRLLGLGES